MEKERKYSLGMDVGGTNSVFGLVDEDGCVLRTNSVKTAAYADFDEYVDVVSARLAALTEGIGGLSSVSGFGIGAPNCNFYTGCILGAPNMPWKGEVPLTAAFSAKLGIPVRATNDANAAAMGEMIYGRARGMKNFIEITLGTGVGSGIVVNGDLLYGCDGFAGELGHVTVERNGRQCGCGRRGCLETYCSATGVARTAREMIETTDMPSLLRNINGREIESKDVFDAAEQGDGMALEIFNFTGEILGRAFADFIAFSAPEAFILFGGLAKSGEYLLSPVRKAMNECVMPLWRDKVEVLVSTLDGAHAAILGAAALCHQ